eukprot:12911995-Prorocentrum_lima.AAC.1
MTVRAIDGYRWTTSGATKSCACPIYALRGAHVSMTCSRTSFQRSRPGWLRRMSRKTKRKLRAVSCNVGVKHVRARCS